jgi:CHASE1-domain containing sensor protein
MLELIMQVSRSAEDRLSGTVRLRQGSELHHFSGTLELMRVFEDLVPPVPEPVPQPHAGRSDAPSTKPRGLS